MAQHEVRVSSLENRVDALETIAGSGSNSQPTSALSARRQRQQQASHWADPASSRSPGHSLGRQHGEEGGDQPGMQVTASLSFRMGPSHS